MSTLEELENKYKELGEEIEKLKAEKENEPWQPKYGEKYWFINYCNVVAASTWYGDQIDIGRYAISNVFRTLQEAEFRAEQLKVEAELKLFVRPFKNNSKNYTIQYWHSDEKIDITYFENMQCGNVYFPSEEIAQKAIDTVGEERIKKYYFGVEDYD